MTRVYVDTSVLALRYLRGERSDAVDDWLDDPSQRFVVSDQVVVELESVVAWRRIAEGPPLGTLDALHLASAVDGGAEVLATDDRQLGRAARAAGLAVKTFLE